MATCANHPQTAAAAYCRTCGKPLCDACKRDVRGVIYCEECLAARVADPAMAGAAVPPIPPAGVTPSGSNPVAALILGFIPGVGAMYNAQLAKGLIHIGIFVLTIVFTSEVSPFFGFAIPAWILYMVFDAFQTAKARQLGLPDPDFIGLHRGFGIPQGRQFVTATASGDMAPGDVPPAEPHDRAVPGGAYWLIGLGVFFLVATNNPFEIHLGRFLWEFVVIGVGIYLLFGSWTGTRRRGYFCACQRCRTRNITGPVMMITVGIVGLLSAFHILGWNRSWPLFLIAFGAVRMVQSSASTEGHVQYVPAPPAAPMPPPPATTVEPTSTTGGV